MKDSKTYLTTYSPSIRSVQGFTIVELMITIAIAGIIATIAMPSLSTFLVSMRVDNQVTEIQRLLLTARNGAVNTGLNTTVCPLNSSNNCSNDWDEDISVFTNTSATTDKFDGTDILIKVKSAVSNDDQLEISTAGAIVYTPDGTLLNANSTQLSYCPSGYLDMSHGIDISTSGRSYIGTENAANKYVDIAGNTFTCSTTP